MRILAHVQYDTKVIHIFMLAYIEWFTLYQKRSTKFNINMCPGYGVMSLQNFIGICPFYNSVANCDMGPFYKGAQLHRFYCRILFSLSYDTIFSDCYKFNTLCV
jgi:hypothetical protein